jgi:hypothetical protein
MESTGTGTGFTEEYPFGRAYTVRIIQSPIVFMFSCFLAVELKGIHKKTLSNEIAHWPRKTPHDGSKEVS